MLETVQDTVPVCKKLGQGLTKLPETMLVIWEKI